MRRLFSKRLAVVFVAMSLGGALLLWQGFWFEPHQLLLRDEVALDLPTGPFQILHLADLHIATEGKREQRLLAAVAREQPDLIAISGDLLDIHTDPKIVHERTAATAAVIRQLRRYAPVVGVQGHSEYHGSVIASLERAGLTWLSNRGITLGNSPGFILLGLNQQVGIDDPPDRGSYGVDPRFGSLGLADGFAFGRSKKAKPNLYSHYDPEGVAGQDAGHLTPQSPLHWGGYTLSVDIRLDDPGAEGGIGVHSQFPVGDDRMLRLRRPKGNGKKGGPFELVPHGTGLTSGQLSTGVVPQAGRWYRLKLATQVTDDLVRIDAKAWPVDETEPEEWQAWAEDTSPQRVTAGTVGLWARAGSSAYRNLLVLDGDGNVLLDQPMSNGHRPAGWLDGTRGTRLQMALARSPAADPRVREKLPIVLLNHVPTAVLEARNLGIDAMLAGHTHGGQIRVGPWPITTRCRLGAYYDRGTFYFASNSQSGWIRLHINSGVGTSKMPVRFWTPPSYARVEVGTTK